MATLNTHGSAGGRRGWRTMPAAAGVRAPLAAALLDGLPLAHNRDVAGRCWRCCRLPTLPSSVQPLLSCVAAAALARRRCCVGPCPWCAAGCSTLTPCAAVVGAGAVVALHAAAIRAVAATVCCGWRRGPSSRQRRARLRCCQSSRDAGSRCACLHQPADECSAARPWAIGATAVAIGNAQGHARGSLLLWVPLCIGRQRERAVREACTAQDG